MRRWASFFFAFLLCLPIASRAAISPDDVEISVVTIGPGREVYERFGHIAIRVHVEKTGFDYLYDWGNFDFAEPNFIGKFVKGSLLYSMGQKPTDEMLAFYGLDQDRTIIEQTLNLGDTQKLRLIDKIEANMREPKYLYDYFRDNCSTRVRDLVDQSVDGQLAPMWKQAATPHSYRWHTRRLMDVGPENKAMAALIDFCCGRRVDAPLSDWDAAFIPMEFSKLLDAAQITQVEGTKSPLVKERKELNRTRSAGNFEPVESPSPMRFTLPIGLALGALTFIASKVFRIGYWILAGLWSAFAAFGAVFFTIIICFTRHVVVDWNENFLQFSPASIAILAAVLIPKLRKPLSRLPIVAVCLSVLGMAITISHLTIQQAAPAIALALPLHLAVWAGWTPKVAAGSANTDGAGVKMPIAE